MYILGEALLILAACPSTYVCVSELFRELQNSVGHCTIILNNETRQMGQQTGKGISPHKYWTCGVLLMAILCILKEV